MTRKGVSVSILRSLLGIARVTANPVTAWIFKGLWFGQTVKHGIGQERKYGTVLQYSPPSIFNKC